MDTEGQGCGCFSQVGATSEDEFSLKTISKSSLSEVNMGCRLTLPGQRLLRNAWEGSGLEKQRGALHGPGLRVFLAGCREGGGGPGGGLGGGPWLSISHKRSEASLPLTCTSGPLWHSC